MHQAARDQPRAGARAADLALLQLVAASRLDWAQARALHLGTTPESCLIAHGMLEEEKFLVALCTHAGLSYEPLLAPLRPLIGAEAVVQALESGVLPIEGPHGPIYVIAPREGAARHLAELARQKPGLTQRFALTSRQRLVDFLCHRFGTDLARQASAALQRSQPLMSSGAPAAEGLVRALLAVLAVLLLLAALSPQLTRLLVEISLSSIFLAWIGLRLTAAAVELAGPRNFQPPPEQGRPIYTLLVPLYREADCLPGLVAALRRLNHPAECLDIKLILEADDIDTLEKARSMRLGPPFEIITVAKEGPRTKPKALEVALPLARGQFLTIYDAEDRPDPDQLCRALDAFAHGGPRLGCVQARLTIDNARDNWLTRMFAAEYAGQFDVFLPLLCALRLPIPLGGTSNHFRIEALRAVGGWDPHNVTEDADLGMRLARAGWQVDTIASSTQEEAPNRLGPWLRQRTRWMKGFMQTWLVHMRRPGKLLHELGPAGFVGFHLLLLGPVLSSLAHPVFLGLVVFDLARGGLLQANTLLDALVGGLAVTTILAGYGASVALGMIGLMRRRLGKESWALAGMPLHWLLLSWAAWRALWQLLRDPFRWEKTEHGLARTSLSGAAPTASGAGPSPPRRPGA